MSTTPQKGYSQLLAMQCITLCHCLSACCCFMCRMWWLHCTKHINDTHNGLQYINHVIQSNASTHFACLKVPRVQQEMFLSISSGIACIPALITNCQVAVTCSVSHKVLHQEVIPSNLHQMNTYLVRYKVDHQTGSSSLQLKC